ncbi:PAS domain S-box protein [Marivirga sp. S37H4]|uniref:histidine kinase n=1 Tax=Marivirga aurantiaca TaxID=2802615 RepID=A0A934WWC8_9BACT|nr:ATP-binding protein [Marivirga aurantiaca]MBK6264167.1 PAS domain S-box protein [Marivirga aurantiaca]
MLIFKFIEYKRMHHLGSERIKEVINYLQENQIQFEWLDDCNITHFDDYCSYYLLIEKKVLYVCSIGEADGEKAEYFFSSLLKAGKNYSSTSVKLTFVMDATGLYNMPHSARKEVNFFDLKFREYWQEVIFIYQGIAKVILDMYELHKPEHLVGMRKVPDLQYALDTALKREHKNIDEALEEKELSAMNQKELIEVIQKLKSEREKEKNSWDQQLHQLFGAISNLSWDSRASTSLSEIEKENPFAPIYGVLNNSISDYNEMKNELQRLKNEFHQNLSHELGETLHQEASLRAIFDSLDSILWYIDKNYVLISFNKNFLEHVKSSFGFVPEVGMNLLNQPQLAGKYESIKERVEIALKGKEATYNDKYYEGDKIVKVIASKVFPVMVDGEILGLACLSNDITESYFTKERVNNSEKLLASVNQHISEAIYRTSSDRGMVYINEAFMNMFGFESKNELYNFEDLTKLYTNPNDRKKILHLLETKKKFTNVEVLFKRKNGETFTGLISSMLTVGEDGVTYFDGAIRDVTAIKSAQQKLKNQNIQLKKLNSELDSFVYSASHDLKAPLSSVRGLINLAKNEKEKDKLSYYLDLIDTSITKLDNFIQDIINLSRNSRQAIIKEEIDFNELVNETFSNFKYLPNFDKIEKVVTIDPSIQFYSDKRRLLIIFNNLVSNSIRYYNPSANTPFIKINIEKEGNQTMISVADNGVGIEKQYLKKIFEMFFRASESSNGSGIGLYIVKETIDKLKGKVSVKSEPGIGSIFQIKLPNQLPVES